jgi:hypothetical protein
MKTYKFTIHASPSEKGAMEGFVITYPMSTVHREDFEGTFDQAIERIKTIHSDLISNRQFESGKGFSIDTLLWRGQHKPRGFDARRRDRCANYIAA